MSAGKINDKVGYIILEHDRYGEWVKMPTPLFESIGQAVGAIRGFQEIRKDAAMPGTYAVGRVQLVMISRPDDA